MAGIVAALSQLISGRILSEDQIKRISNDAIGKHFKDFLPIAEKDQTNQDRVEKAQESIARASGIIGEIKKDLDDQTRQLNEMLVKAETKKQQVEKYSALATMAESQAKAVREELTNTIRNELEAHTKKGRRVRQLVSLAAWLATLILGAALSSYFKDIWVWARTLLS